MSVGQLFSSSGNTSAPTVAGDGFAMSGFLGYVRSKWLITLTVTGGTGATFSMYGLRTGRAWAYFGLLASSAAAGVYSVVVDDLEVFDRICPVCTTGAPSAWSVFLEEIEERRG